MLAGLGGLTGVLAGLPQPWPHRLRLWDAVISWESAGIAFAFSVSLGIVFGIYPAVRAAPWSRSKPCGRNRAWPPASELETPFRRPTVFTLLDAT